MKTKFNHEGKRARQFKQQVDQLTAENKVLQKKLKNLQGRKEKGEDPRIKNLLRENKQLKKQIKLLMIELNKKRRWFQRCIKSFKSSRGKWVKKQEEALKKKGYLIKYVFLDDVKRIQAYKEKDKGKKGGKGKKKYKNKIKVKSRDGGVIVLKDVEFMILDDDDDDDGSGGKGKKGKKGKKSKGDQLDEMEDYIAELEKEFGMDQAALGGNDDSKELDSDDDFDFDDDEAGDLDGDYTLDQLAVDAAADSIDDDGDGGDGDGAKANGKAGGKSPGGKSGGKSPGGSSSGGKSPKPSGNGGRKSAKKDYLGLPVQPSIDAGDNAALQAQLVYLKKELDDRTDDIEKLKEIMSDGEKYPDPKGEVKNYILQINKRGDELVDKLDTELHADQGDIDQMKGNNDRWQLWLNKFAGSFAKNGALFNQLLEVYEYYLKELKGRVDDLTVVNNAYYTDKNNDEKPKEEDQTENEDGDKAEDNTEDNADENTEENKEDEEPKEEAGDDGDDFSKLKKTVGDRHVEVEGQFKTIQEKQDADAEEEEKEQEEDYGAGDKEREELDANSTKVKEIRDNLVSNNISWREIIDIASKDYENATSEKGKLVQGLSDATTEFKELLDLVQKIPKRKILDDDNNEEDNDGDNNENQDENAEEAANGDGGDE